jgi:hypothetical protein
VISSPSGPSSRSSTLRATSSGAARSRRALLGFAGAFETQWLAAPKNFAGEAGKKVEDLIAGRFNRKGERCRKCSMAKGIDVPVNRSERVFYRRNVDVAKITLPWRKRD